MTNDQVMIALLTLIALEVTYLTYRTIKVNKIAGSQAIFVDTSVLMDGRIVDLAATGFIPGELVIPRSVIGELQLLADNGDSEKRERARRGLDVVRVLQDSSTVDVSILADGSKAPEGVDERLLALAKKHGGKLLTIDYNLNKVAQVEDITVLNINDLAKNLRMTYLPGDHVSIDLTQPGSDSHQAVGHLDDGTMVVVEHAKSSIGKHVEVEIVRSLQTSAGRMMFAKLVKPNLSSVTERKSDRFDKKRSFGRKPSEITAKPSSTGNTNLQPQPKKPRPRKISKSEANESRLVDLANR